MFLLILFCSTAVYAIPAFNKEEYIKDQKLMGIAYVKFSYETLGECDAGNMNPSIYESLGIPQKEYKLSEYFASRHVHGSIIELFFGNYTKYITIGSIGEQNLRAKKEHPELKDEIDQFVATSAKIVFVHLKSVLYQLRYKKEGLYLGVYETPIQRYEAVFLLNHYKKQLVELIDNFGSETPESLQTQIDILNESKVLNLDCDFKCVQEQYDEWLDKCKKENDTTATEAPERYPVAEQ